MTAKLIRGARVFDGTSFVGVEDVAIEDGVIVAIGSELDNDAGEVIDARGATLLPGLIDSHTHVFGEALVDALPFGVTTAIDMFTDASFARRWRQEQERGEASERADIVSSGHPATAPGGHGTQYGIPIDTLTTAGEAARFVDDRIAEGSQFLKIIWERGDGTWPTLDEATIEALIDAARRAGIVSVIHISRQKDARRAIELGVGGLAHIFADEDPDDDLGTLAASAGAFVIPTLSVIAGASGIASGAELAEHERLAPLLTPSQRRSIAHTSRRKGDDAYRHAAQAVGVLHRAGTTILAGTDAANVGTTHGASIHREIELLTGCGLDVSDALAAATSRPAAIFGLTDRGVIRVGARADLILVDGDPSSDIRATREIAAVWKQGVRYDHDARTRMVLELLQAPDVRAPVPAGLGDGRISDFDDGTSAWFGFGWKPTSDAGMGGGSSVALDVVEGGAAGTARCLELTGEVGQGYLFPWAGVAFHPGAEAMKAADLSSMTGVAFWAKGDGGEYVLAVRTEARGYDMAHHSFTADGTWTRHEVSFEELDTDGSDVTLISFLCVERRAFRFSVDEVELVASRDPST